MTGVRALVDSGSLLWRARLSDSWRGELPAADVLDSVEREVLERPATAFTALHVAVALTAAGDLPGLRRLRDHALGADLVQREVVGPLCEAFAALVEERFGRRPVASTRCCPCCAGSAAARPSGRSSRRRCCTPWWPRAAATRPAACWTPAWTANRPRATGGCWPPCPADRTPVARSACHRGR
ncbi:hypothetical protein O1M54_09105 [Streptomyces diastatochromogenes]|nr:hypothetical protein [Streptomyces diastatochromogenes]